MYDSTVESLEPKQPTLDLVMLLGAGASIPAGIPPINEMTDEFLEKFPKNRIKKYVLPTINTVKKIAKFQFGHVDLETIMSVLVQLEDTKYRELLESKFPKVKQLESPFLSQFKQSIQKFIREKCENLTDISYFWSLRAFFTNDKPLKIFTLNYDGTIEFHCEKEGIDYSDGFNPYWDTKSFSNKLDIHLYKLHGSLYWFKSKTSRPIKIPIKGLTTQNLSYLTGEKLSELMIYPEIEKNKESVIYSNLSQRFKDELLKIDVCIVIGYSFRDRDITETINESLLSNSNLWLILVNPTASEIKNKFFPNDEEIKSRVMTLNMGVNESLTDRTLYSVISTLTKTRHEEYQAHIAQSKNQERLDYEYWTRIIRDYLKLNHDDRIKYLVERLWGIKFTEISTDYPNVIEMMLISSALRYALEYKTQNNLSKMKIWKQIFLEACVVTEFVFFKDFRNDKLKSKNPIKQKELPWWYEDRHFGDVEYIINELKDGLSKIKTKNLSIIQKKQVEKLKQTTEILTYKTTLENGSYKPITSEEILIQYKKENLGLHKWAKKLTRSL